MGRHKLALSWPEILCPTLAPMPAWVSEIEPHLFDSASMAQLIHNSDHFLREKQELTLLTFSSTQEWFKITEVKNNVLNCVQQPADSANYRALVHESCVTHNLLSKEPHSALAPSLIGLNLQRGFQHTSSATSDGSTQTGILKVSCKCDNLLKWGWKPKKYR